MVQNAAVLLGEFINKRTHPRRREKRILAAIHRGAARMRRLP